MRRQHKSICQPLSSTSTSSSTSTQLTPVPAWKTVSRRAHRRAHQLLHEGLSDKFAETETPKRYPLNQARKERRQRKQATQLANVIDDIKLFDTPSLPSKKQRHQKSDDDDDAADGSDEKEMIKRIALVAKGEIEDEEEKKHLADMAKEYAPILLNRFEQQISHINDSARNNVSRGMTGIAWYDEYSLRKRRGHHRYHARLTLALKSRRDPSPPSKQSRHRYPPTSIKSQHIASGVNDCISDYHSYSWSYRRARNPDVDVCKLVDDLSHPGLYRGVVRMRYCSGHRSTRPCQLTRASYRAAPRRSSRAFVRSLISGGRLHGPELLANLPGRQSIRAGRRNVSLRLDLS